MAKKLAAGAVKTIKQHSDRWSKFRSDGGDVLTKYFDNSFEYLEEIVDGKLEPKEWISEGLALLIGYFSAGHQLYQAANKLYPSRD